MSRYMMNHNTDEQLRLLYSTKADSYDLTQLQVEQSKRQPREEELHSAVPMAAVKLSGKTLTELYQLYPHFPLDNLYNLFLVDCPWQYYTDKFKPDYKTLSMQQLKKLPFKHVASENSVMLMWTTGPMKQNAIELMKHFGFTYRQTMFYWVKTKNGKMGKASLPGTFSKTSCEELIVGTRGNYHQFLKGGLKDLPEQVQLADTTRHSEKPDQITKQLAKVFQLGEMKCLEVFARKRVLEEFDLYGDELTPRFQPSIDKHQVGINSTQLDQQEINARVRQIMEIYEKQNPQVSVTKELSSLVKCNIGLFAFSKAEFGLTDILQHHIVLKKDARPIARAPYKVAPAEDLFIDKEVEMLLALGCIEESNSEWASPVVLVKKANGDLRMCIDYRGLNKETERDQYPLPRIDQFLVAVCRGNFFTKLDLKSGFWQVSVYIKDRKVTSFVCKKGTFQWKRMPFGLTNAPATFQRLMNIVLKHLIGKCCLVYIDDIIIYSDTMEQHLKHIQQVFDALTDANLKLGYDKCVFFQDSIELLGHKISHGKYEPLESRVKAILDLQRPTDVKGIQMFLGLVNYHGQFIKDLAKIAKPLRELTKKETLYIWTDLQELAFNKLKRLIAENPVLYIPLQGKLMILYTDFSQQGLGAVLSQEVAPREERVIEYASRTLKKHESNYPAYKGEVLAVSWAVNKFRYFLLQAPFRLVLDNLSAVQLLEQYRSPERLNNLQRTVLNWVLELVDYDFTPVHRPGVKHSNADALSRLIRKPDDKNGQATLQQVSALAISNLIREPNHDDEHSLEEIYTFNWWGVDPEDVCIKCLKGHSTNENDIVYCDLCGKAIHQKCHVPRVKTVSRVDPWYCNECVQLANSLERKDITLDFPGIDYLKTKKIPEDLEKQDVEDLLLRTEDFYFDDGRIRFKYNDCIVPTVTERRQILRSIHDLEGHTNPDSLYASVATEHYWTNMYRDCKNYVAQCPHCQQMNPKFVSNPILHPTNKGTKPFDSIRIDLSGDLQTTPTKRKNRYLFILVDSFSKWVEVIPIQDRKSSTTRDVLWRFITQFGTPSEIITDKGSEFEGEFTTLCRDLRVNFHTITARNPQANGMAERTVKTVKSILRRFVNSPTQKGVEWDEAASCVQMSINITPSQTTKFSPYKIVFGRDPCFPSSVVVSPPLLPTREPTSSEVETYVKAINKSFTQIHPAAQANIKTADDRNTSYYNQRHRKQQVVLSHGDTVMVKIPKVTKLGPKGKGPFVFNRYLDKERLTAELIDPTKIEKIRHGGKTFTSGKTFMESTSNLAKVQLTEQYEFKPEELTYVQVK